MQEVEGYRHVIQTQYGVRFGAIVILENENNSVKLPASINLKII